MAAKDCAGLSPEKKLLGSPTKTLLGKEASSVSCIGIKVFGRQQDTPSSERVSYANLIRGDRDWVDPIEGGVKIADRVLGELLEQGHDGQSGKD